MKKKADRGEEAALAGLGPDAAQPRKRRKEPMRKKKKLARWKLPPEVEKQICIHGHENIREAFVAALSSLQNPITTLKSEMAGAFDMKSCDRSLKYDRARYFICAQSYFHFPREGRPRFLSKAPL